MFAHAAFRHTKEDAQHRTLRGGIALIEVAQPFKYGEHPLAHRRGAFEIGWTGVMNWHCSKPQRGVKGKKRRPYRSGKADQL